MVPIILFVPGFWEGASPFSHVSSLLQSQGYATETVVLPSTGAVSPGNPSMEDDIAAVQATVEKQIGDGQDILLVLHSAGGFLGSNAIEGLTAKTRSEKGLQGGVVKIVFLSGAVFPEGFKHGPLPFALFEGGAMTCAMPEKILFNDLDDANKEKWIKALKPQPAEGWDGTITYCGWKDVPSVYLVCESDGAIPAPLQLQLAEMAGSRVEKCDAGHMPMLSMPERVVEVITSAAAAA